MAEITVTIPNSTFTVTQVSSGIEVTTPTDVVVEVSSSTNEITVVTTPDEITVTQIGVTNTDQLIEGTTNLFFTNARADARVALGIAGIDFPVDSVNGQTNVVVLDTDDISEGSNKYYSNAQVDAHLSGGTGITYTTGAISIDFTEFNTDNINEGTTNQYFTNARARSSIMANDLGGDGSLSYDDNTGVITYTGPSASEVRAHFTAGTGVTITSGTIAIGQAVATTDQVTFASVSIDSRASLDTATLTTSATTADQVLDSFSASAFRTAKYVISITSGTDYQAIEMLVVHNGTTVSQTTYADITTNGNLATFNVDINSGLVRILTTPVNAVTVYKVTKTAIVV